jgi:predicted ATPase
MRLWKISDFKAIGSAELDLGPLSLIAGSNSSGKSSVIQSLLFLAQNLGDSSSTVLNGPLLRLGGPRDVIRSGQNDLHFDFSVSGSELFESAGQETLTLSLSLGADETNSRLVMKSLEIHGSEQQLLIAAIAARVNREDQTAIREQLGAEITLLRLTHEPGPARQSRTYIAFQGIRPVALAKHVKSTEIKTDYLRLAHAEIPARKPSPRSRYSVYAEISRFVPKAKYLEKYLTEEERTSLRLESTPVARWNARDMSSLSDEHLERILRRAAAARANSPYVITDVDSNMLARGADIRRKGLLELAYADEHELGIALLESMFDELGRFADSIKYIGPLREEPRVVHGAWDQSVDSLPVGFRGELTAEVLAKHQNTSVTYFTWKGDKRRLPLPDAVSEWCRYFGIADKVTVEDQGKLGRGVYLSVNGMRRDLTTVGVGASQLLPVVVAALLVGPGDVLLMEQPELHLHPAVQSKLADFFAFARPDVAFVVETHSEYMITRLRRRVAEEKIAPERIRILFAEQSDGITSLRRLDMDALGDLHDWPEGFFDSQDLDSVEIMRAVQQRVSSSAS